MELTCLCCVRLLGRVESVRSCAKTLPKSLGMRALKLSVSRVSKKLSHQKRLLCDSCRHDDDRLETKIFNKESSATLSGTKKSTALDGVLSRTAFSPARPPRAPVICQLKLPQLYARQCEHYAATTPRSAYPVVDSSTIQKMMILP